MSNSPANIESDGVCQFCNHGFAAPNDGSLAEEECTSWSTMTLCRGCCTGEGFICDTCDELYTEAETAARRANPAAAERTHQFTTAAIARGQRGAA